ncbi:MAG: acetyl-CoA C-acetyltransferase [Nitriliruptor sp.]|uniref:acetyl-CoA C-acetyltransferase n=1 Tax=Nitriliruptor sp. TaxID=2448056 RepID=UPI0034A08991
MSEPRRVAILGGNRIPFARSNGPYAEASNQDMLTEVLDGLVARFGLQDQRLGEVVGGAVLKHSRDFNLTRESVLGSKLDGATPAYDVSQACGTGLQTAFAVGDKIALGRIDVGIAAGVDTTSDAPIAVSEDLRRFLLSLNAAKTLQDRIKLLGNFRPGMIGIEAPRNAEPRTGLSMGQHMQRTADRWGIDRESQDEIAVASHRNAAAAYEAGFFDNLVSPYLGLTRDQNLRPDSDPAKLAKLGPAFPNDDGSGTLTAANSTPLSDGASSVLLASEGWAEQAGLTPLAYLVDHETAAVDYVHGDDGLLTAPIYAVPRLLARNGLSLQDFDLYEIHEAFASTVLVTLKAWESEAFCREQLGRDEPLGAIDRTKLNPHGSSLAFGHPFAATGGRILASAAKQLDERGGGRALISICAAGGNGVVAILER